VVSYNNNQITKHVILSSVPASSRGGHNRLTTKSMIRQQSWPPFFKQPITTNDVQPLPKQQRVRPGFHSCPRHWVWPAPVNQWYLVLRSIHVWWLLAGASRPGARSNTHENWQAIDTKRVVEPPLRAQCWVAYRSAASTGITMHIIVYLVKTCCKLANFHHQISSTKSTERVILVFFCVWCWNLFSFAFKYLGASNLNLKPNHFFYLWLLCFVYGYFWYTLWTIIIFVYTASLKTAHHFAYGRPKHQHASPILHESWWNSNIADHLPTNVTITSVASTSTDHFSTEPTKRIVTATSSTTPATTDNALAADGTTATTEIQHAW